MNKFGSFANVSYMTKSLLLAGHDLFISTPFQNTPRNPIKEPLSKLSLEYYFC